MISPAVNTMKELDAPLKFLLVSVSYIGSLMLAIPRPLPGLGYLLPAKFCMDAGFGAGATAVFRECASWSKPVNKRLNEYNVGTMTKFIGASGASSGFIAPLFLALLVALFDKDGYQHNFYFIAALSFIAAIATFAMHKNVKHEPSDNDKTDNDKSGFELA